MSIKKIDGKKIKLIKSLFFSTFFNENEEKNFKLLFFSMFSISSNGQTGPKSWPTGPIWFLKPWFFFSYILRELKKTLKIDYLITWQFSNCQFSNLTISLQFMICERSFSQNHSNPLFFPNPPLTANNFIIWIQFWKFLS